MNPLLTPTYWGSLIALILGLVVTTVSVIRTGLPQYVTGLPPGVEEVAFYSVSALTLIYSLRYYCMVYLNAYGDGDGALRSLDRSLRRAIFGLLVSVTVLCLLSAGAIIGFGLYLALLACLLMSGLSFAVWLLCWGLSKQRSWPPIKTLFGGAELALVAIAFLARELLRSSEPETVAIVFPMFVFASFIIFAHEFMQHYGPTLEAYLMQLRREILD